MRRKIKLDISGLNAAKLIEKAGTVVTRMTDNANFPSPTPSLAELTAAYEALAAAAVIAGRGDREAISARKEQELIVANMLRNIAAYIVLMADGNGTILLSSGFEIQSLPEPQPELSRPINFKAVRGAHEGEVDLGWKSVKGAMTYVVGMTTDDPKDPTAKWTNEALTTKVKVKFENMGIGNFLTFRVKAVGRNNESPWSDISMVMTAA